MARRCFERCDAEDIRGSVRLLRALSDTKLVATQGPVWLLEGKILGADELRGHEVEIGARRAERDLQAGEVGGRFVGGNDDLAVLIDQLTSFEQFKSRGRPKRWAL